MFTVRSVPHINTHMTMVLGTAITTTTIGSRTSILIISSVGYRHSGQYTCRAINPAGADTHSAMLRVNGT